MSSIEDLVYSAHEHGRRESLFKEVAKVRAESPNMELRDVYSKAYTTVMKT